MENYQYLFFFSDFSFFCLLLILLILFCLVVFFLSARIWAICIYYQKKIKKKCLPIDKNDRIVWLMDENTLQKDIYYRLVSLLAEDYLFEGVNCCLFEMFKKIKKRTYLVVCLFIVRLQNNVGFSKRVERLCSKGSFQHLVIYIGGRQDKFPWSKLTLLQFTTSIHKHILASILEVCLVLEIQHLEG